MTEETFERLEDFIQAKIELNASQRQDGIQEYLRYIECRRELRECLGLIGQGKGEFE